MYAIVSSRARSDMAYVGAIMGALTLNNLYLIKLKQRLRLNIW